MLIKAGNCHYLWFNDNSDDKKALGSFDLFERKNSGGNRMELWSFGIIGKQNRGKGYGQKMLQEAIAMAGGKPIRLYVHKTNTVAIHIYQKAGFNIIGKYMGEEAWVMQHDGNPDIADIKQERKVVAC
jgi:ribosomal protein S18 acetylase RimI-like enzyme